MRDLYKRLGLDPKSTPDQIKSRLRDTAVPRDLRRDAETILLVDARRRQYDAARSTLEVIGRLHAALQIRRGQFWSEGDFTDFRAPPAPVRSKLQELGVGFSTPESRDPDVAQSRGSSSTVAKTLGWGLVAVAAVAIVVVFSQSQPQSRASRPAQSGSESVPVAPAFTEAPLPFPETGLLSHIAPSLTEGGPFEVRTAPGGGYFLKVMRVPEGTVALTAFVSGGQSIETLLPVGTYELRYAAGDTWYGPEHLFGPNTKYSKADSLFTLVETPDGYQGVTVELILQRSGNLRTEQIPASAF